MQSAQAPAVPASAPAAPAAPAAASATPAFASPAPLDTPALSPQLPAALPLHTLSRASSSSSLASSCASSPVSAQSGSGSASPTAPSSLRSRRASNLTLDLTSLPPPLQQQTAAAAAAAAAVPTNTLLFTGLDHADLFRPDNLETIRDLVNQSAPQGLHSWAPLRSFRRIVASFFSAGDAARVRAVWDGERMLGATCQVYFGRWTPLDLDADKAAAHLALPDAGKLFFISPPPSPPHDWEMRLEGAPNKQVHAEDLADALARLHHQAAAMPDDAPDDVPMRSPDSDAGSAAALSAAAPRKTRSRSSTLVIYQPDAHSSRSGLPAIAVEDMTDAGTDDALNSATWAVPPPPIKAHTARPPVELMYDA